MMLLLIFATTILLTPLSQAQILDKTATVLEDSAEPVCFFVGQVALPFANLASFSACFYYGNESACKILNHVLLCMSDSSCNETFSLVTESGCKFFVEQTVDFIRITGESNQFSTEELREVFDNLNTVTGMQWLVSYFGSN